MAITIDGKTYRNQQEQIYQNTKDIEELKKIIKYLYFTSETLTSSSVSIALTDTNIPSDIKEGYLIDSNGLLFKIDGNDGTTVLLTYYSNFRGPTGQDGQDGVTPSITANASVDSNVGTPSVSVTKSGTDENPVFTFAFHNIKGETGTSLISVQVVANLPASGDAGTLYFVPNNSGETQNAYDEYIWVNNAWEKLGTQTIDLTNYIQKSNTSGLVKNDGTIDTTNYVKTVNNNSPDASGNVTIATIGKTLLYTNNNIGDGQGSGDIDLNENISVGDNIAIVWVQGATAPAYFISFFKIKEFRDDKDIGALFFNAYYGQQYSVSRLMRCKVNNKIWFDNAYSNNTMETTSCIVYKIYKITNLDL